MSKDSEKNLDSMVRKAFANCRRKGISKDSLLTAMSKYGVSSVDLMTVSQKRSYLSDLNNM